MNLHNIVAPMIAKVNPWVTATMQSSNGYTTNPDGSRVPVYLASQTVKVQMQALQYNDLQQISGLNIQGERHAMYLNGRWDGVVRPDGKGGDLITLADGSRWLVALVLENWSYSAGWSKLCVTRQM